MGIASAAPFFVVEIPETFIANFRQSLIFIFFFPSTFTSYVGHVWLTTSKKIFGNLEIRVKEIRINLEVGVFTEDSGYTVNSHYKPTLEFRTKQ